MSGWVVAVVAALWLIRVGVEARRWWRDVRESEMVERTQFDPGVEPRSHVTLRADPFDQDRG